MIDLHSHIIYSVDDGSRSLEESIAILKEAYEKGITDMVATPHYMKGAMTSTPEMVDQKLKVIKERLIEENIDINLYSGHEVYVDASIFEDLENKEINTIEDTDYLLIELPLSQELNNLEDLIFELQIKGYNVILAHPERYHFVQQEIHVLDDLVNGGVLLQLNISSLTGRYGEAAQKTAKELLRASMIHILGTDVHHQESYNLAIEESKEVLQKLVTKKMYDDLLVNNGRKVLTNEAVTPYEIQRKPKGIKGLFSKLT
jgi:protein-tyrosine phosphatase